MNARFSRFLIYVLATSPHWIVAFFLYPAGYGKMPFIFLSVSALLGVFIVSLWRESDGRTVQNGGGGTVSLFERVLVGSLLTYPVVLLVSGIFGVDPFGSFFGEQARQNGVVMVLAFVVLTFFVKRHLAEEVHQHLLSRVVLGSAALAAFVALLESLVPSVRVFFGEGHRFSAWFGNPNFLASYLAVAVPFSFGQLFRGSKIERVISGALILLCVYGVALTGSRGGLLGVIAGLGLVVVVWGGLVVRHEMRRVRILIPLAIGVLIAGLLVMRVLIPASTISRLVSPEVWLTENTPRLLTWQIAWEGFKERPILGWGTGQFRTVFDRYYKSELLKYSLYETVSDKAHNLFLEQLATTGVIGFISFIVLVASAIGLLVVRLRQGTILPFVVASYVGVFGAALVSWFFLFETPPVSMFFFMTIGLLLAPTSPSTVSDRVVHARGMRILLSGVILCLLAYLAIHGSISSVLATRAIDAMSNNPDAAGRAVEQMIWVGGPYSRENVLHASYEFLRYEESEIWSDDQARQVAELLRNALTRDHRSQNDFASQFVLGQLHTAVGTHGGGVDDFAEAHLAFERARLLSPQRQAPVFQTGHLLLVEGKTSEAVDLLTQQVADDPDIGESYWFLALALAEDQQNTRAADTFHDAMQRDRWPKNLDQANYVIDIFNTEHRWDDIVSVYQHMLSENPRRADLRANLAATYAKAGKPELAIIEARHAAELDPSFAAEAEVFIRSLQDGLE